MANFAIQGNSSSEPVRPSQFAFWTSKLAFGVTVLLFLLSPVHAFFMTWFRKMGLRLEESAGTAGDGISVVSGKWDFLISSWREIALMVLFLCALPRIWSFVRGGQQKNNGYGAGRTFVKKYWAIFGFLSLSLIFLFLQRGEIFQWLWGIRFNALFFISFIIFSFLSFSEGEWRMLLNIFFGVGFFVTFFGLIHALFLPHDALIPFGYSINRNIWDVSTAISSCQPLEHTDRFCRAISTFGGPTRYGTYLLLLLSLSIAQLVGKFSSRFSSPLIYRIRSLKFHELFFGALAVLAVVNILLTFSRSIWIGLLAMTIVAGWIFIRRRLTDIPWEKILPALGFLLILMLFFLFFTKNAFQTIFLRTSSTSEHFLLLKQGLKTFLEHPLGIGLGKVGPASLRFTPFITENWYLQIGIEMGWLGLFFFMAGLFQIFRVFRKNSWGLPILLALLGISIAGFFTHSFEETTTVILLGALLGMQKT